MADVKCNRCGKCCFFDGRKCPYLLKIGKLYHCRIYNAPDRIGKEVMPGVFCNNIMDVPTLYDGCPYNELKKKSQ